MHRTTKICVELQVFKNLYNSAAELILKVIGYTSKLGSASHALFVVLQGEINEVYFKSKFNQKNRRLTEGWKINWNDKEEI